MRPLGWAQSNLTGVLIRGANLDIGRDMSSACMHREGMPRTGWEGGHLQAKGTGFRKTKTADILTLDFQPPELWENKLFNPPSLWYFLLAALIKLIHPFSSLFGILPISVSFDLCYLLMCWSSSFRARRPCYWLQVNLLLDLSPLGKFLAHTLFVVKFPLYYSFPIVAVTSYHKSVALEVWRSEV